jgi:hypothetical protein
MLIPPPAQNDGPYLPPSPLRRVYISEEGAFSFKRGTAVEKTRKNY